MFDGWAKDGDINTAHCATVVPFHAMSGYPPPPTESYPDDGAPPYRTAWNTRTASSWTRDLLA
jgi:hypothetical protein